MNTLFKHTLIISTLTVASQMALSASIEGKVNTDASANSDIKVEHKESDVQIASKQKVRVGANSQFSVSDEGSSEGSASGETQLTSDFNGQVAQANDTEEDATEAQGELESAADTTVNGALKLTSEVRGEMQTTAENTVSATGELAADVTATADAEAASAKQQIADSIDKPAKAAAKLSQSVNASVKQSIEAQARQSVNQQVKSAVDAVVETTVENSIKESLDLDI